MPRVTSAFFMGGSAAVYFRLSTARRPTAESSVKKPSTPAYRKVWISLTLSPRTVLSVVGAFL